MVGSLLRTLKEGEALWVVVPPSLGQGAGHGRVARSPVCIGPAAWVEEVFPGIPASHRIMLGLRSTETRRASQHSPGDLDLLGAPLPLEAVPDGIYEMLHRSTEHSRDGVCCCAVVAIAFVLVILIAFAVAARPLMPVRTDTCIVGVG